MEIYLRQTQLSRQNVNIIFCSLEHASEIPRIYVLFVTINSEKEREREKILQNHNDTIRKFPSITVFRFYVISVRINYLIAEF